MRLSVLSQMVERTAALDPASRPADLLRQAFERGLAFLEASTDEAAKSAGPAESWREAVAARATYDLLRHRALAISEQSRQLDQSVDELATESLQLHDRLWEWHAREGGLKVQLGRRKTMTPRPEPAPMIGTGGPGKVRTSRAERLLEGLDRREIELDLPPGLAARAEALAHNRCWDHQPGEDGALCLLAHGLAALELGRVQEPAEVAAAPAEPRALEALRYRVFELTEANRVLEIRQTAFTIDNRGMRIRLGQLEQEVTELEEELAALREKNKQPSRRLGLLERLFHRLGRPAP